MSFGRELKDFVASFKTGADVVNQQKQTENTSRYYDNLDAVNPSKINAANKASIVGANLAGNDPRSNDAASASPAVPVAHDAVSAMIIKSATARGIDPNVALRVAKSEGLGEGNYIGDSNSSFGPFQLHYGNVASGGNAVGGLGDAFTKATGLDARDPKTVQQQIDFALDQAKKDGWGAWHGAAKVGIGNREGLDGKPVASAALAKPVIPATPVATTPVATTTAPANDPEPYFNGTSPILSEQAASEEGQAKHRAWVERQKLRSAIPGGPQQAVPPVAVPSNQTYYDDPNAQPAAYADEGGMMQRPVQQPMVLAFANGGEVDPNAPIGMAARYGGQYPPQNAAPASPNAPMQSAIPAPASNAPMNIAPQPPQQGVTPGVSYNQPPPDMNADALHAGLTNIAKQYGLTAGQPAIQNPYEETGAHRLAAGSGKPSDADYAATRKIIDPDGTLNDTLANVYVMKKLYEHYMMRGEKDKAANAASEIIEYTRSKAAEYGNAALHAKTPQEAAELVAKGLNQTPTDQMVKASPNASGGGTLTHMQASTGKVINVLPYTPEELLNAALGLKNGNGYWKHIMSVAKANEDDTETAAQKLKAASQKASTDFLSSYNATHPNNPLNPAQPGAVDAAKQGMTPGAASTTPASTSAENDDDEEDSALPATPAPGAIPTGVASAGTPDPRAASQTASINPSAMPSTVPQSAIATSAKPAIPAAPIAPPAVQTAQNAPAKGSLPPTFMQTLTSPEQVGKFRALSLPEQHQYQAEHKAQYDAQQKAIAAAAPAKETAKERQDRIQGKAAASFDMGDDGTSANEAAKGSNAKPLYKDTLTGDRAAQFAAQSPQFKTMKQAQYEKQVQAAKDKEPDDNAVPTKAELEAEHTSFLEDNTPEGGKAPIIAPTVKKELQSAASNITTLNPHRDLSQAYQDATQLAGTVTQPDFTPSKPKDGVVTVTIAGRQPIKMDVDTYAALRRRRGVVDDALSKAKAVSEAAAKVNAVEVAKRDKFLSGMKDSFNAVNNSVGDNSAAYAARLAGKNPPNNIIDRIRNSFSTPPLQSNSSGPPDTRSNPAIPMPIVPYTP